MGNRFQTNFNNLPCKPFKKTHEEQITLINNLDWLHLPALTGIDEEFREILKEADMIDNARKDILCSALFERVGSLHRLNAPQKS